MYIKVRSNIRDFIKYKSEIKMYFVFIFIDHTICVIWVH